MRLFQFVLSFYARIPTRDASKKRDLERWLKVDGTNARLIFFCFFSQGKKKKAGEERQARSIGSKDQERKERIKSEKERRNKNRTRHLNLRTRLDHDAKFIDILRRYNRVN